MTTGPQPGSPAAPFEVIASATLTSVLLKWKNPDYRGQAIIGYILEANNLNKKGALEWQPVAVLRNGRQDRYELSFTQLSPSTQYKFRLMAINQVGVSEPAYPNKLYGSASIIRTPSHLELRSRMPYYKESWFVILCACASVIITIVVVAGLCVHNKTMYKYNKKESTNSNGSQDRLSELGFGLDDNLDQIGGGAGGGFSPLEFEMRATNSTLMLGGPSVGNGGMLTGQRGERGRSTMQRNGHSRNRNNQNSNMLNTASIAAQAKQPPRPSPGSFSYSDEDDDDDVDVKPGGAAFYESSGNDSLTEKPSELSSTGPESESEDHDDLVAANQFVNHYANVNDTLRKGISWKKQAKPYIVPTSSQHSLNKAGTSSAGAGAGPSSSYRPLPYPPSTSKAGPSGYGYAGGAAGPSHYNQASSSQANPPPPPPPPLPPSSNSSSGGSKFPSRPAPPAPPPLPNYHQVAAGSGGGSGPGGHNTTTSDSDSQAGVGAAGASGAAGSSNALNGGRIIVNNMAGSRAPLPGFSSFV